MRGFDRPGRTVLLTVLFLAAGLPGLPSVVHSQERTSGGLQKTPGPGLTRASELRSAPAVDVLHYDLHLRPGIVDGSFSGRACLRLRTLAGAVELHAAALAIDSARVNGAAAAISIPSDERIRLDTGTPYGPGDTLEVDLWYRRPTGIPRPPWRDGYYWFSKDSVTGLPASVGYTVSQPSDTRFWLPCHDEPFDKATADLAITVPENVVAASNGRFLGRTVNGDGTATWRWREQHPVAPYLLCVTASEFTVSSIPFVRAPGDTIPLQYFVWREDSAACAAYLPTVRDMMDALSSLFGPYPFDKYGMTAVTPFALGGMEHQTITTLHRALKTNAAVVVHELAHQWWGNLVTCEAWEDIWLNEGFASYCEVLWEEHLGGAERRNAYLNTAFNNFSSASWEGAIYDPESQGFDLFSMSVYTKAAWVLHTLRGVLGDSLFFASLLEYRARYAGTNATTDGFREVVESVSGRNLQGFFQQWIRGRGWPEYSYDWAWNAGSLTISIRQVQPDGYWPVYSMPIQFRVSFGLTDTVLVVQDSLRSQEFVVPMPERPVLVEFDPFNWILKRVTGPVTTVRSGHLPVTFGLEQNHPNPFNGSTEIGYRVAEPSEIRLTVCNVLGREVATLVQGRKEAGHHVVRFDAGGLASGVYLYRLTAGSFVQARKLLLIR